MTGSKDAPARRTYHHGDLRRALLSAAEEELSHRGLEAFSLRGCARRAGVSHAAPAHHFGDAAGLLAALATDGFARFVAMVDDRQATAGDARARLVAAGLGYVAFARENPALFDLMFASRRPDFDDAHLSSAAGAAFDQLARTVSDARGDDALASGEGRRDIAAVWGLAHGLANLALAGRMSFLRSGGAAADDETLADVFARLEVGGT